MATSGGYYDQPYNDRQQHLQVPTRPRSPDAYSSNHGGDRKPQRPRNNDCCAQICAAILFIVAVVASIFVYQAMISCEFAIITMKTPWLQDAEWALPSVFRTVESSLKVHSQDTNFILQDSWAEYEHAKANNRQRHVLEDISSLPDNAIEELLNAEERSLFLEFPTDDGSEALGNETATTSPILMGPTLSSAPSMSPRPSISLEPTRSPAPSMSPRPSRSLEPSLSSAPTVWDDVHVTFSVGLFQFSVGTKVDPRNGETEAVCTHYYNDPTRPWPVYLTIARWAILLALGATILATFLIGIDYVFCNKLPGGRLVSNTALLMAMIGVPTTFVVFADSRCHLFGFADDQPPNCELGKGARKALVAEVLLFVTFATACIAPTARPLVKVIRDLEADGFWECDCQGLFLKHLCACLGSLGQNCLKYCFGRGTKNDDEKESEDLMVPLSKADRFLLDIAGHSYKQYHDETAGYTLQNQYTASYKRWLRFEEDYDRALDKFKEECKDAGVEWRVFLRKARSKERNREDSEMEDPAMEDAPQNTQDDVFFDEELLRHMDVLSTLRTNCDFAKEVMKRIQKDINDFTAMEDEKQSEEEEGLPSVRDEESPSSVRDESRHSSSNERVSLMYAGDTFYSTRTKMAADYDWDSVAAGGRSYYSPRNSMTSEAMMVDAAAAADQRSFGFPPWKRSNDPKKTGPARRPIAEAAKGVRDNVKQQWQKAKMPYKKESSNV